MPAPVLVRVPTPEITPLRVAFNPLVWKFPPAATTLMRRSELKLAVISKVPPLKVRIAPAVPVEPRDSSDPTLRMPALIEVVPE